MAATRIHHLNFVVRDLDKACRRFESLLGVGPFETVDHAARGSHIAYCEIGESRLVLVCPYDPDSVPGRYLAKHGEGFFLLSVGTDEMPNGADIREGILDWQVADMGEAYDAVLQLTSDSM